ncbi:MAG: hypothetical protein V1895_03135 [Parcubacteria group bacterium]
MTKKTSKVTLESLDKKIDTGFANTKLQIENLAAMTARGFEDVETRLAARLDHLKALVESRTDNLGNRIDAALDDIHEVRDKIDQASTREELEILEQRVVVLERKVGIKQR